MMDQFNVLSQNMSFVWGAYNVGPFLGFIFILAIVDVALKGWGMWRAARLEKLGWFIALLIINSMGILPVIFLLLTNEEYEKKKLKKKPKKA
jgi:MFS family permease